MRLIILFLRLDLEGIKSDWVVSWVMSPKIFMINVNCHSFGAVDQAWEICLMQISNLKVDGREPFDSQSTNMTTRGKFYLM
ncbi:hypothetical protein WL94_02285 [Burkholderia cepacia]|nr:hypothetical protein WL94_02285 [Burkholderia cepacia]